jgi:hypothetical protein
MRAEIHPGKNSGYRSISAARLNTCSQLNGSVPLALKSPGD